jgi:hypothetical protein
MPKFDVKLNPVRCIRCGGTGKMLKEGDRPFDFNPADEDAPDLTIVAGDNGSVVVTAEGDEEPRTFLKCEHCNGLGFRHEMSMDGLNVLKLITPTVKGTATSRPPADDSDAD